MGKKQKNRPKKKLVKIIYWPILGNLLIKNIFFLSNQVLFDIKIDT